jgi:hypothetical protein
MSEIEDRIADTLKGYSPWMTRHAHAETIAALLVSELGLTEEVFPNCPDFVEVLDENGNPVMNDYMLPPTPKHRVEWVTKRRWMTPIEEVGPRLSSEEFNARLKGSSR